MMTMSTMMVIRSDDKNIDDEDEDETRVRAIYSKVTQEKVILVKLFSAFELSSIRDEDDLSSGFKFFFVSKVWIFKIAVEML